MQGNKIILNNEKGSISWEALKASKGDKGILIAIDGLDGSGKATQSKLLVDYLKEHGEKARLYSFPVYERPSSTLVKMFLAGEFGEDSIKVNHYAVSMTYALDRYAEWKRDMEDFYNSGGILICDRYISSNALIQGIGIDNVSERRKFYDWCYETECRLFGLPEPDVTLLLLVHPETSVSLLNKRYDNDESRKDIIEGNIEHLTKVYNTATEAARYCGWKVLECDRDGKINSIEQVHSDIKKILGLF